MKGKRRFAAEILTRTGILSPLRRRGIDRLIVLNYHRIRTDGGGEEPFDSSVFGPTLAGFREHMAFMKRHFRLVSENDLIAAFESGDRIPGPCAMITFDDAYRDFIELACPALSEMSIPALLFVPTGIIDKREVGWWDMIAYFVKKTRKDVLRVGEHELVLAGDRAAAIRRLQLEAKALDSAALMVFCEELAHAAEVNVPSVEEQDSQLMTWEDIRRVGEYGVALGAHSVSHPVLANLGEEEQRNEMVESLRRLSSQTDSPVRSMAYPVGGRDHFTDVTKRLAREAGYKMAFTFTCEVNRWPEIDPYAISRCECSDGIRAAYAKCLLPGIFT